MTWAKNYVLVPDPAEPDVQKLARRMAARYAVPAAHCFAHTQFNGFQQETNGCVQSDVDTKLIICGHGNRFGITGRGPENIANYLKGLGVTTVGLVAFKACAMGKEDFLEKLKDELDRVQIDFGWLIAYKGDIRVGNKGRMRGFWGDWEIKGKDESRVRIIQGNGPRGLPRPIWIETRNGA